MLIFMDILPLYILLEHARLKEIHDPRRVWKNSKGKAMIYDHGLIEVALYQIYDKNIENNKYVYPLLLIELRDFSWATTDDCRLGWQPLEIDGQQD